MTVVKHDPLRRWAGSYSVRGIDRPRAQFEVMVEAAIGEKRLGGEGYENHYSLSA